MLLRLSPVTADGAALAATPICRDSGCRLFQFSVVWLIFGFHQLYLKTVPLDRYTARKFNTVH